MWKMEKAGFRVVLDAREQGGHPYCLRPASSRTIAQPGEFIRSWRALALGEALPMETCTKNKSFGPSANHLWHIQGYF